MEDVFRKRGNLVLGVALAAATGLLLRSSVRMLQRVREATQVTKDETPDSAPLLISRRTEDAIKTETLGTLYESPNYDIRQAATKMLVERVFRTPAYDSLLRTITAHHSSKQAHALACLRYLHVAAPVVAPVEHQVHAIYALVKFLASRNARSARRAHTPDTDWCSRPRAEADALAALVALAPARLADVLRAGAVTRWLARFPFGGHGATPERRREVVRRLCQRQSDDWEMTMVLASLMYSRDGQRQLRQAGLIGSEVDEAKLDGALVEGLVGGVVEGALARSRARGGGAQPAGGLLAEEAALRRRRRQAMVYGEQGQPVTRDNIYEGEVPDNPWEMAEDSETEDELAIAIAYNS